MSSLCSSQRVATSRREVSPFLAKRPGSACSFRLHLTEFRMNLLPGQQLSRRAHVVLSQLSPHSSVIALNVTRGPQCQLKGHNAAFYELYDVTFTLSGNPIASFLNEDVLFLHQDSAALFMEARQEHIKTLRDCLNGGLLIRKARSLLVSRTGRLKPVSRVYYLTKLTTSSCEVLMVEDQVVGRDYSCASQLNWCDETFISCKKSTRPSRENFSCLVCGVRETTQARYEGMVFLSLKYHHRRGPGGAGTLCNSCGLRWTKKEKIRELLRSS